MPSMPSSSSTVAVPRLGLACAPPGRRGTGRGDHDLLAVVDARGEVEGVQVGVRGRAARAPDRDGHARALGNANEAGPADRARHVHEVARRRGGAPRGGSPARDPDRRARLPLAAARQAQQRDPAEDRHDEPDEQRSGGAVGHEGDRRRRRATRGLRVRRVGDIAGVRARTSRKAATLAGKVDVSASGGAPARALARLEARQTLGRLLARPRRAPPTPRAGPCRHSSTSADDRLRRALEHGLDGPVAAVAHPAGDARASRRRPAHGVAEEHTLDVTVHDDVDGGSADSYSGS